MPSVVYVGQCRLQLAAPYVPSEAVPCDSPGCGHEVWIDLAPAAQAMRPKSQTMTLCLHCAQERFASAGFAA